MNNNNHGGKRDNHKKRADDKRGGKRTPGPGKKLGRPKKAPAVTGGALSCQTPQATADPPALAGDAFSNHIQPYIVLLAALRMLGGDNIA